MEAGGETSQSAALSPIQRHRGAMRVHIKSAEMQAEVAQLNQLFGRSLEGRSRMATDRLESLYSNVCTVRLTTLYTELL